MASNKAAQLVFVPCPGAGHLFSAVEVAKLLVDLHPRLSITVLIMRFLNDPKLDAYLQSISSLSSATHNRINFLVLPEVKIPEDIPPYKLIFTFIDSQIPNVRDVVRKLVESESRPSDSPPLAGLITDMFCVSMLDVAKEFGVPSYLFYASSAACLAFSFRWQALTDEENVDFTDLNDSDTELTLPFFANSVPIKVFPASFLDKDGSPLFLNMTRKFRDYKGIIVNTFRELQSSALDHLSNSELPPVYPVGPLITQGSGGSQENSDIIKWLDDQPPMSVVFLCFGSFGSFNATQVKEIACALEQSGYRFLWSLRQPQPNEKAGLPMDCENLNEILPGGFLDRTAETGKVIGWAPQTVILAHPSIGGFVSHCGWNSTLESIWFGVPIATWPMYAEQQFNAFEIVKELGLGVDIRMDYRKNSQVIVSAAEIERAIRCVMEQDTDVRKKIKDMSEKSRMALNDDGSSRTSLGHFINDVMSNVA